MPSTRFLLAKYLQVNYCNNYPRNSQYLQAACSMRGRSHHLYTHGFLKNVRHEKFAQCVASGLSGADAYRQAAEYSGKQADGNAANWMKRPGVRERIEELKAESSARCSLSREAYIRSLVEMYEAKPGDASMDNPRCDVLKHLPECVPHVG